MANIEDNIKTYATSLIGFDESSGNVLDSKGGYVGTITGATRVAGWNGQGSAMNFDGNDYVTFNNTVIPIGAKSIRFKFKKNGLPSTSEYFLGNINSYATSYGITFNVEPTGQFHCGLGQSSATKVLSIEAFPNIFDNKWHDILFTWDGTTNVDGVKLYIDDMTTPIAKSTATTIETQTPSLNLTLGRLGEGGNYFIGQLDQLEIYDRAISPIQDRCLVLHNTQYKYHDGTAWQVVAGTEQDFITYGMESIDNITEPQWSELVGTVEIHIWTDFQPKEEVQISIDTEPFTLSDELGSTFSVIEYTDNLTKEESVIVAETEPYSVYDYISETPEVLVYTELDEDITVETTTEPFDLYDEFGDSVDVLYYTDDESVNEADLILESNWSPLDELEGDFEVVLWTDEPSNTAQRVLEMTAVPNPQFIKLVNPLKLYGYLEDVLIDDISQTYKNKKETRYLISDEDSTDWYVFDKNTREFKIVDASTHESIIENGMTFEDLNSIEEEDWKKWGKEWLNIGVFLKDNKRDTIVSVIDNMSYKDLLPRDTSSLSETSLYILNTTARIDISINGNTIKGVLSDDDLTRVQYRVLLNGEHYYPEDGSFTDLSEPPQNIGITFTSKDIKVDELNTVRVEFRDFFGTIDYWEADFIGTYSGLVFKDIYGDYFSTEIGEVLKYLDFGVIVAGQVTVEHEIILKNQYGYDVKNIQLFANTSEFPDGLTIQFSDSLAPFNPQEKLIIPEVLENGEELSFYVRLRTTLGTTPNANGSFDIIVKADRV